MTKITSIYSVEKHKTGGTAPAADGGGMADGGTADGGGGGAAGDYMYTLPANFQLERRQLPMAVTADRKITKMIIDLRPRGLSYDHNILRARELDDFAAKYQLLTADERLASLTCSRAQFVAILSQSVPCVGCRRSVERLYDQLQASGHPTLEPVQITSDGVLTVLPAELLKVPVVAALLHKNRPLLTALLDQQPRNKKSSRCTLHSLDSFRSRPFSEMWREVWSCMQPVCRDEITQISTVDLHQTLDLYLKKHKFCAECRTKVEEAYGLLLTERRPAKEKGYVAALYANIKKCIPKKHIHLRTKTEFLDGLIRRAEPELNGNHTRHRERHAKTLEIAQEEVLTCIGMFIYERLRRIHLCLKEEENAVQVLGAVAAHTLARQFDAAVEQKRGISNLELLYQEISRAERAKKQRQEQKKLKKKQKKLQQQQQLKLEDEEEEEEEDDEAEEEAEEDDEELEEVVEIEIGDELDRSLVCATCGLQLLRDEEEEQQQQQPRRHKKARRSPAADDDDDARYCRCEVALSTGDREGGAQTVAEQGYETEEPDTASVCCSSGDDFTDAAEERSSLHSSTGGRSSSDSGNNMEASCTCNNLNNNSSSHNTSSGSQAKATKATKAAAKAAAKQTPTQSPSKSQRGAAGKKAAASATATVNTSGGGGGGGGGYGSETTLSTASSSSSRTSSLNSSPDGSEVACSEACCNHTLAATAVADGRRSKTPHQSPKQTPKKQQQQQQPQQQLRSNKKQKQQQQQQQQQRHSQQQAQQQAQPNSAKKCVLLPPAPQPLTLQQMLDDSADSDEPMDADGQPVAIPAEVVLDFAYRQQNIKAMREKLRQDLRQRFAAMCASTSRASATS